MSRPKLTERTIRNLASEKSFERGRDYLVGGAVSDLVRRGDVLTARVAGNEFDPYAITIHLRDDGIAGADCSCPYDWGGHCKHIVAVLLSYVHDADEVVQRPPVADLLKDLDHEKLMDLLLERVETDPWFADWIEARVSIASVEISDGKPDAPRRALVDPEPIRRQARNLLRRPGRRRSYWEAFDAAGDAEELQRMVDTAVPFLEAGDGRNALRILEPIADSFVKDWTDHLYEHDEDMYVLFGDLGCLCADAVLIADLSMDEREDWAATFQEWQEELDEYGVDEGFQVAADAAAEGWDDPALQEVLRGESRNLPATENGRLTGARLRVLERQDRYDEYLRLASASGHGIEYAAMLVRLDRIDEAVGHGLKGLRTPNEALNLAVTLKEHGHPRQAIEVAEAGLDLCGTDPEEFRASPVYLARWLREFAAGLGEEALSLRAAATAFRESLALDDYRAAEGFAGENWRKIKAELLDHLATADHAFDRTDIYLLEGMIDEAVRSVGDGGYVRIETLMKLAGAATGSHPNWVIGICRKRAEPIMDEGRSKAYATAAQWLAIAKRAYHGMDRHAEWSDYLAGLLGKHARRYKLRPLLEDLA